MLDSDRILGTLLGTAVGDALGMPIDGLSHQNVRTYYKGIKGYRADEHRRDFEAGQWTAYTQRAFVLANILAEPVPHATVRERYDEAVERSALRRPGEQALASAAGVIAATPLYLWWSHEERVSPEIIALVRSTFGTEYDDSVVAAAVGQAHAVRLVLAAEPEALDGPAFFEAVTEAVERAEATLDGTSRVSARLHLLAGHLDDFPLDLQDLCDGTGAAADEVWPFALAMVARNPLLLEATLLPAINVGGAASAIGSLVGSLVGALHGWAAFPTWARGGLEDAARLETEAHAFADALLRER